MTILNIIEFALGLYLFVAFAVFYAVTISRFFLGEFKTKKDFYDHLNPFLILSRNIRKSWRKLNKEVK